MSLEEIKSRLNKKFKTDITRYGADKIELFRIPFSSPRLNYLTRGGIPGPGAIEISGPEGAGKTTLLNDLIKNAQQKGLLCALIDAENKYDVDYAKWLGVDIDNLLLSQPRNVSGEEVLELALNMIAEGIRFCAIDSLASLVPKSILSGTMEDKTYCGSSGILSTFSQKLSGSGLLLQKRAILVGINQVRDKLNGFGLQTPGGHFWRHICLARFQITAGNPFNENYSDMPYSTTEKTAGYKIEVKILKNQFMKNDRRFNYATFHYEKGFDVLEDLIDVAIELGVIVRAGAWYRIVNKETGEILCVNDQELKFQGKAGVRNYLEQNTKVARWIEMQVNKYMLD